MKCFLFTIPDTFTPDVSPFEQCPDGVGCNEWLIGQGWTHRDDMLSEMALFETVIWEKEDRVYVDISDAYGSMGEIVCADFPSLLMFLRLYVAPLQQIGLGQMVYETLERIHETILDDLDGVEVVQRVARRKSREWFRRKQEEAARQKVLDESKMEIK